MLKRETIREFRNLAHNIKKHIYFSYSISVIHLSKILELPGEDKHEHDNDDNNEQEDDNNRHICQQCAKRIE